MKLKQLTAKDKKLFNYFLKFDSHELSTYAFENIYIWKGLFDISWSVIEDCLYVFFKDKTSCFLYLAPLGKKQSKTAVSQVFKIMDRFNRNKDVSRIENVEEKDLPFYQNLGLDCRIKSYDYLCRQSDLARLTGNKFKSKRSCFNYFTKHYKYAYLPFSLKHRDSCLKLYNRWARQRKTDNQDPIYQAMLKDSYLSLKKLLFDYRQLCILGRVVKINNQIKAFTFGFKLSPDIFCILFEIADLSVKGLAQFIFRSFCQELKDYKYINIMDDSGLDNLKQVKLSYQPLRLIPSYIVKRKNA